MEDEKKTKKQLIEELNKLRLEQIEQTTIIQDKFTKAFLQNSIPTVITTLKEGRIVDVSNTFLKRVGLKRDEVVGRTSREIGYITEEQRASFINEINKSGCVEDFEMEIKAKNGELRYGLFNAVMMSFNNEKFFLTTIQDITDRKRAEKALSLSRLHLRLFMDANPDLLFLKDSDLKYLMVNTANTAFLGREEAEILGKTDEELMPEQAARACRESDLQVISQKITITSTESIGDNVYETIKFPVTIEGDSVGVGGIIREITKRIKAEAEKNIFESRNRQIQKSESLGRMAGAIAHHFNNQLGVVIGNLELAMMKQPQMSSILENLTSAMKASNTAAQMSGHMLTYLGQLFDEREPLNLSSVCRRSLPILQAVMPETMVLQTNLSSPGPVIMANLSEIQQIMTNLITNAWEACGKSQDAINLTVKTVFSAYIPPINRFPIDWQPQNNAYACLEVADTGCGIADMDIEKLFDPFFTDKFTGRGMGLPVVLGIVKAHNGAVTVESKQKKGSAFRVFLPLSTEEVLPAPDKVAKAQKFEGGGKVLLAEDDDKLRIMVADMLKSLGFTVLEAKDGVEAVELFRQHQDGIRIVLSDLTMPRMNGWETMTVVRQLVPGIPVILSSGYDEAHVMAAAGDHSELPQAFLGKPYMLRALSDAIGQALASSNK